jgi:hypothetical protein
MFDSVRAANLSLETVRIISSPPLGRPFRARRLTRASVAWINYRWFQTSGGCALHNWNEGGIRDWILNECAFAVPSPSDNDQSSYGSEGRLFYADSYGETGKAFHGGSARAGTRNGLCIKGIGVTPLLGIDADPLHSHGSVWLEEAVREAIFSEILHRELPCGVVPVVALIDTGIHAVGARHDLERRALIVRPFVFRPSHLQRSPMFRTSDGGRQDQLLDVARTKLVADLILESPSAMGAVSVDGVFCIRAFLEKVGRQIAYCQANRLSHGGFLGSNLSLDGRLLDFGAARALPTWSRVTLLPGTPGFGGDVDIVCELVESLCFYLNKFAKKNSWPSHHELISNFKACVDQYFREELLKLWGEGLDRAGRIRAYALQRTIDLYDWYQKYGSRVNFERFPDEEWSNQIKGLAQEVISFAKGAPTSLVEQDYVVDAANEFVVNSRLRPNLFRGILQESIFDFLNNSRVAHVAGFISLHDFINSTIEKNTSQRSGLLHQLAFSGGRV